MNTLRINSRDVHVRTRHSYRDEALPLASPSGKRDLTNITPKIALSNQESRLETDLLTHSGLLARLESNTYTHLEKLPRRTVDDEGALVRSNATLTVERKTASSQCRKFRSGAERGLGS
jgi:hypothetical protein